MYTIRFTKNSNPSVFNSFWRAIELLKQEIGHDRTELILALQDRYSARLIKHHTINQGSETEYVFQFPDEKTYALFLLKF